MLEKSITFIAYCDFCSEDHTTDEDDFSSAVKEIKREGWRVFKDESGWNHKCPSCLEDDLEHLRHVGGDGSEFD